MRLMWFTVVLTACVVHSCFGVVTVPTEDLSWTVRNFDATFEVPATVPGGVYTDLMNNGFLDNGDFYFRYNDFEYRWVASEYWIYETSFDVTQELLDNERVILEFDGLDTYATISVNDAVIQTSNQNMFARNLVDVKEYLTEGPTKLSLEFRPPIPYSNDSYYEYKATFGYEVLPECVDPAYKGECHANMIRKMQASFSWDWGPAFPNSGIWKPWRIVGWSSLKLTNLYFDSVPVSELPVVPDPTLEASWTVNYKVYFDLASSSGVITGVLSVVLNDVEYVSTDVEIDASSFTDLKGVYEGSFIVPEGTVQTWWPNGYGTQTLYNLTATLSTDSDTSTIARRVGFRTLAFDESFVDPENESLGRYYRAQINNVFMFMKGSNWIPAHVLPEQVTPEYTRQLLQDAKDTHQNCIRVWGGGIYETDKFYDYCDEFGLLVWEDMMFACSMYPADDEYLARVADETRYQVQRLQHHASLLLWATNNENEAALKDSWYGTDVDYDLYKADYIKLYVDVIAATLKEEDTSRPVIISSPSNGIASEEAGYIADNPYDNRYGDTHFYNYIANGWHYENYPPTRFASEYGFQSFPSFETFAPVLNPEDMFADSPMMEHRQHHPGGQLELTNQLQMHFDYDVTNTSFEDYLYLVQLHQAIAIKTETEFYRRMRSTMNADGSGLCMGALYWQLNDVWQGASWSTIEYGGRWKIGHNFAKDFFSPIIAVPWIDGEDLKVTIVSDLTEDYSGVQAGTFELYITFVKFHIGEDGQTYEQYVDPLEIDAIAAQSAELVSVKNLESDLDISGRCAANSSTIDPYDNCYLLVDIRDINLNPVVPTNFLLLREPKNYYLPPSNFTVTVDQVSDQELNITLISDQASLFVYLESPFQGVFSTNGFLPRRNTPFVLGFLAREPVLAEDFRQTLKIKSVTNSYDSN